MRRAIKRYLKRKNILFLCPADCARTPTAAGMRSSKTRRAVETNADFAILYRSPSIGMILVWLKLEPRAPRKTTALERFHKVMLVQRHVYVAVKSAKAVEEWF